MRSNIANCYYAQSDFKRTLPLLEEVWELIRPKLGLEDKDSWIIAEHVGTGWSKFGDQEKAKQWFDRAADF
jgi:hypothetical protein